MHRASPAAGAGSGEHVSVHENKERGTQEMSKYTDIVKEFCELSGNDLSGDAWKMMQLSRLDRIADALEGINDNLSCINNNLESMEKNLDNCIVPYERQSFLCVTGNVTTD